MTGNLTETVDELKELSSFFTQAELDLKDGKNVDMTGIDERISKVCRIVETAPPEQQETWLPELDSLLKLLNSCELALHNLHLLSTEHDSK